HLHDLAERPVLLSDPPLVERERIRLLEILGPCNVLARDMDPSDRYEGRELFRPFDRNVIDWHRFEIGTKLDLEVEIECVGLQFVRQRRIEHVWPSAQVELTVDRTRSVFSGRREADLRDIVAVTDRTHAPERRQQRIAYRRLRQFDERE